MNAGHFKILKNEIRQKITVWLHSQCDSWAREADAKTILGWYSCKLKFALGGIQRLNYICSTLLCAPFRWLTSKVWRLFENNANPLPPNKKKAVDRPNNSIRKAYQIILPHLKRPQTLGQFWRIPYLETIVSSLLNLR